MCVRGRGEETGMGKRWIEVVRMWPVILVTMTAGLFDQGEQQQRSVEKAAGGPHEYG